MGYSVQGSDMNRNANVERLISKGAKAFIGHEASNVEGASVVVVSSAIKHDNPELVAARQAGIPVVLRAEMLAELMRMKSSIAVAGTHGKTTTTSLISTVLCAGKIDPTVINGGIIEAFGSNARVGQGQWLVAEADESDGSFLKLPAQIGIITNIDPEHMEHYGDFDGVKTAFKQFSLQIPFYGFTLAGIDHPVVREVVDDLQSDKSLTSKKILTYGEAEDADIRLINCVPGSGELTFDLQFSSNMLGGTQTLTGFKLPMPGHYNALNAAVAVAVAHELGVEVSDIRDGLAGFSGVKRRFTHVGSVQNFDIYDDYAHHPVEISSVLGASKSSTKGRVIAIMQPHRYSRLECHFEEFQACFDDADIVVMAPVFAAGENPLDGINHETLGAGVAARGNDVRYISHSTDLAPLLSEIVKPGDLIIGLGAGSISNWMHNLPNELKEVAA
jgi:UDP-N-acetylmuramate--alanine ligase